MTLNLCTPCFSRLLHHPCSSSSSLPKLSEICPNHTNIDTPFPSLLFFSTSSLPNQSTFISTNTSVSESHNGTSDSDDTSANLLDQQLILQLAINAKDANNALQIIANNSSQNDDIVSTADCCSIISVVLNRNNPLLAHSIFYTMRATFHQVQYARRLGRKSYGWHHEKKSVGVLKFLQFLSHINSVFSM